MAQLTHIGGLTLAEFDRYCRLIARRMAQVIRQEVATGRVDVHRKTSYAGVADDDVVTSADIRASECFVDLARQYLPQEIGLIGEEQGLRRASLLTKPSVVLTSDPADGSRALAAAIQQGRRLVPGEVSAMLGVQSDGVAVGAYICDVASQMLYTRLLGTERIFQVTPDGIELDMSTFLKTQTFEAGVMLHHGKRDACSQLTQDLLQTAFGKVQRVRGSIGLSVMRVFRGEFVALLRPGGTFTTPWDDTPLQAMCSPGDVAILRVGDKCLEEIVLGRLTEVVLRSYDILYVHRSYLPRLGRHVSIVAQS